MSERIQKIHLFCVWGAVVDAVRTRHSCGCKIFASDVSIGYNDELNALGGRLWQPNRRHIMPMAEIPEPLIDDIAEGRCLPFIGAGFSLNAKLPANLAMPDWRRLANELARAGKIDSKLSPPVVAEQYEQRFGRVQLIDAIRKALFIDLVKPGTAHLAFAALPFDTVYTTNFDLLLEESYASLDRPFRSIVGEQQMPFYAGKVASNIVKLHGDLRHEEHITVTQRDYDQFLERYPVIATHLSAMLITRTPLFIGYSLSDSDFIHIRSVIRARLGNFERMAYVLQFDASNEEITTALNNKIHLISLSTSSEPSRDAALSGLLQMVQRKIDTRQGAKLRASRPDAFEFIDKDVVEKAVELSGDSSVLAATSTLCFVLMPFSSKFDAVYRKLIVPVVEQMGLNVVRADELSAPGSIMEQIRVAIQQSRMCIVDLTDNNANVLFELGLAHAAQKPTVLLSQDLAKIPFDVHSQRVIVYNENDLQASWLPLKSSIKAVLSSEKLTKADSLFALAHYRAAILEAFIILDVGLRRLLEKSGERTEVFGRPVMTTEIVRKLEQSKVISAKERELLHAATRIRNVAVHSSDEPKREEAIKVIDVAKLFMDRFDE